MSYLSNLLLSAKGLIVLFFFSPFLHVMAIIQCFVSPTIWCWAHLSVLSLSYFITIVTFIQHNFTSVCIILAWFLIIFLSSWLEIHCSLYFTYSFQFWLLHCNLEFAFSPYHNTPKNYFFWLPMHNKITSFLNYYLLIIFWLESWFD